jgi:phage terminase small subunit
MPEIALLPLNSLEERFCQEFIFDLDAAAAAARAGYRHETEGPRLLGRKSILRRIQELKDRRATRLELKSDDVLKRWWAIATADPNEIVQLRRVNCRYCHGVNHEYQWTPAEYEAALLKHAKLVAKAGLEPPPAPNDTGGTDFAQWREPSETCPECSGAGVPTPFYNDTRELSPGGRALYGGLETGAGGALKLRIRDQEAALLNVAKHLGMHIDRRELSGPGGEPLEIIVKVVKPPTLIDGFTEAEVATED